MHAKQLYKNLAALDVARDLRYPLSLMYIKPFTAKPAGVIRLENA